ncbi:MAG: hypothetical protein V9H26_04070 [Verrucomicrobiota bacterium]
MKDMSMSNPVKPLDCNFDLPWPQKGDALVTSDGDNFFLVRTRAGEDWETYVAAYRMAAEKLVEQTSDGTLAINWLVFPIWYLYRHYLELRLKSLIWDGNALEGVSPKVLDKTHNVLDLWRECRASIERWQSDCPKADLDAVEETLGQFEEIDPKSQAARYTKDKLGNPSGLLGIEINLKTFADTVTKAANFLDAAADVFSQLRQSP